MTTNNEDQGPLPLIMGPECPSCGRDNTIYEHVCTSDDCAGVILYAAAPDLLAAAARLIAALRDGDPQYSLSAEEGAALNALDEAVDKATEGR